MFDSRGDENFEVIDVVELVKQALSSFKRVDLQQATSATKPAFPKEGAFQQMFFGGLTSFLPAKTEVVAEMPAILPDRGDRKREELDFYVNSFYYYGIELMREGGSFKDHKERFLVPSKDSLNRSKYFTPLIKEFIIVDFRRHEFKAANKDEFKFDEHYSSCVLERAGKKLGKVEFV